MNSSDSLIIENVHSRGEFEAEYSIHSTKSPSELDYEQNEDTAIANGTQGLNNQLNNLSTEHNDEINSNLAASMEKLSKKKRFKYKIASKFMSLLHFKRSRKSLSMIYTKRRSHNLNYNLTLPSSPPSPSSSSKYFSFLRKLSKNNHFNNNKINSNKSTTIESSIEKFERSNSKSSIKLNFSSLLLNNICIAEDVDIKIMETLETTYNFNEKISTEENFKSIFEILPLKPKLTENTYVKDKNENFDLSSTKKEIAISDVSFNDNSNINMNTEININSINALLKKRVSILSKPGKFEEYLKLKFEELEETRKVLGNFLKNSENQNSLQSHKIGSSNFNQKKFENQRLRMYIQLANKLSEVSFECLLTKPNELMCQLVYNKDGVRVWKKEHKSGRVLLRTEFIVPIAPLDYVEYSTDSNNRRVYDNNTVDLRIVENVSPGLDVMYVATKRIATVYPRDIVNIRYLHGYNIKNSFKFMSWDELSASSTKINQDDVICCSCSCSTEHPDAPERTGYVRMDLTIGSYMAIPIKTPFGIWSSISMFNEASPKGWIPSSITKMIAAKMVPGSVESIVSSMLTYYKLPFKNKVNRPFSGFCYRALSAIYVDQKKLELNTSAYQDLITINSKGVNNGAMNFSTGFKNTKSNSKISCLLNKPLLMSIQDFIASYKSNSFQEFIEHFNSVQIINRYIVSASSNILSSSNSDLLSSSTDASRNLSTEVDHSKSVEYNADTQLVNEQNSKLLMYNLSLDKLTKLTEKCSNATFLNQAVPNTGELRNFYYNSSFERPSSFEFFEAAHIVSKEQNQSKAISLPDSNNTFTCSHRSRTNHKRIRNLFIDSCKLYQDFGASYLTDFSDIAIISRILSLD
ncbi:Steroidogenic acute regulatory (STAR) related lipid transfer [Cryptosporidium sp. chipmunk genotype I]|uniref:Steroidogenic acute regulatory (STAR) related lipid transfer n=1 Tax=Cryptosporidium sp. chipmunk genotype I TaxID=1280935 RepID=UPI00351A3D5D|nr:Steroidogenic acute regulatory (STAR) related lipid transfer [Cryptosporidium sp. chipmunk genotype I]